jgi:hypothetical protein
MRSLGAAVLLAVLATGCMGNPSYFAISCRSDKECDDGKVCFPEGCGDPGQNIVVEVIPNPKGGLHAQDFQVEQLRSQQNIELFDPSLLRGRVHREDALHAMPTAYAAPVTVRMAGESLLIPGVARRHESTLVPVDGAYSLPVGAGSYSVTLLPADTELPPLVETRDVQPGQEVTLDFLLPDASELTRLGGKVVRLGEPLVDTDLEVQALDAAQRPLSQRMRVTAGTGSFTLSLPPSAALFSSVLIRVMPTSADAPVPQKVFTVNPRLGILEPLELGDYGEPVTVRGRVLGPDGQPLEAATVYLQGKVGGGGQYRSGKVLTSKQGHFELRTLPGTPDSPMLLYVIPPPGTGAGLTLLAVTVPRTGTTLRDVTCSARLRVQGSLLMPSGSEPAAGVKVVAEPLAEVTGWPRPAATVEAPRHTDARGHFEIALDPGRYRLDFIPSENLPRVSRILTVRPGEGTTPEGTLPLPPFPLSKGRQVTGAVSFSGKRLIQSTAPYASIRFFRVVNVDGQPSSLLLAQTLTDQDGSYSATLPTR